MEKFKVRITYSFTTVVDMEAENKIAAEREVTEKLLSEPREIISDEQILSEMELFSVEAEQD